MKLNRLASKNAANATIPTTAVSRHRAPLPPPDERSDPFVERAEVAMSEALSVRPEEQGRKFAGLSPDPRSSPRQEPVPGPLGGEGETVCYPCSMPSRATLSISVTPELRKFVAKLVKSGRYTSASEVMREALRLLQHQERQRKAAVAQIKAKIAEGLAAAERGDFVDGEDYFASWDESQPQRRTA